MKRLLCVLMVLVMAVLLVPTMAVADDVDKIVISPSAAETAGCSAVCTYDSEALEDCNITGWSFTANPVEGWTFVMWIVTGWEGDLTYHSPNWIDEKRKIPYSPNNFRVEAVFAKVAPDEPEPIVVVEEKKPEEPHVHAEVWVEGTPATCTHTGLTDGSKCKWCGEVLQAQKEIPKIDHVYSMWVPNRSGKHFASCLYCGNKIDAACEKVQLPIKSSSGAAITLCPVCGDCNGATATAVKGLKVGEGAPYRGTLRVWNIDAGDGNKYLAVSFDRFGKIMQPEGEVSVTLPDDLKGTTAGVISADGNVKTVQESNGTLKLDFTGSQVVVLKGN